MSLWRVTFIKPERLLVVPFIVSKCRYNIKVFFDTASLLSEWRNQIQKTFYLVKWQIKSVVEPIASLYILVLYIMYIVHKETYAAICQNGVKFNFIPKGQQ